MEFIPFPRSDFPSPLFWILNFLILPSPLFAQPRHFVVTALTSCIQLVKKPHSFCLFKISWLIPFFAIPMDIVLVQNLIIATLSLELFPKTLMAMSFPTWRA